jgi:hypothetical protein
VPLAGGDHGEPHPPGVSPALGCALRGPVWRSAGFRGLVTCNDMDRLCRGV